MSEPLREPGLSPDLVTTEAAKELLRRPVFPAIGSRPRPLGGHIAVNGHDLARIEAEAAAPDVEALREALILAHDHHDFGPTDCTPDNCSAEAAIRTFASARTAGGRTLLSGRRLVHGEKAWRRAIALGAPFDNGHTHGSGEPCDSGCYPLLPPQEDRA